MSIAAHRIALMAGLVTAPVLAGPAHAQSAPGQSASGPSVSSEERPADEIIVYGRALPQIGEALSGSQGIVGFRDFANRPLSRVGELVENVPGVIATQHSGTGKANQYFLRGFNLDHGTDFAGFVDGVPTNMRTHGHGQGYLDLNFLIPELVERIDYRKGPYFADVGDFSAAGTVAFTTARTVPRPIVELTLGSYGYYRALAAGSAALGGKDLLVALDGTLSNGPWALDEDLHKINALAKLSSGSAQEGWSLSFSAYHADWNATDQVPRRAIASGLIGRFGNIDPYLGGRTTRLGLTLNGAGGGTDWTAYATYYDFRLTSNFTYFLEDPVHSDEFQQRDRRGVFGARLRHRADAMLAGLPLAITLGADARYDRIGKVGLYHSLRGTRTNAVREDRVDEYSGALFGQAELALSPRLRLMLGLRGDLYGYDVDADNAANSGNGADALLAPKAALAWRPADPVELYANYGESFHSNDVRGATIRVDPVTGDPADRVGVLVRARGGELGGRVEFGRFTASLVGYYLTLGSELVFVGDGGSTEPNAASRRHGGEATLFWRPFPWLALDASGALTHTRFRGVPAGEDRIPNAVSEVLSAGASLDFASGLSASLRLRHFGGAPLIEDGSARSQPTTLVNLGAYYTRGAARLGVDMLNLFDARDADITYFYASRLPGEPAGGVEDRHLHPVEPRQVRVSLRYAF
ncbi:TonB-dependent receptor [Novosphingobium album (ex Liu et al. 2023)]|uniref:TonB-dependent receptor n=1 Tax=Novosphingobium album (ex Liu et al. 2023) TaxID=3031130 RepID=A0ABT5WUM1_9SPHN|nr:TonB-dependent receptor [Novosphingobium album (ex Liu et al. 2023)]MDE8653605.1 TonB-dependent receptor [Novosphingobium album (ex Liu et al. 2023)]